MFTQSPFSTPNTKQTPHFPIKASNNISLGLNPFHGKSHVKETLILKTLQRLDSRQSKQQHLPGFEPIS